MASRNHNLCFAWLGDFDSLKKFVSDELKLNGVWEHDQHHHVQSHCFKFVRNESTNESLNLHLSVM